MSTFILVVRAMALNLILIVAAGATENPTELVGEALRLNRLSLTDARYDGTYYQALRKLSERIGAEATLRVVRDANRGLGVRQKWQLLKRSQRFKLNPRAEAKSRGRKLKVIYINGTNTTETYALVTLERMREVIGPDLQKAYATVSFENFYNFSFSEHLLSQAGLVLDLQEAALQSVILNARLPNQGFMALYSRDLKRMSAQLRAALDDGWEILLVTHSQGGLFANQLQKMHPQVGRCRVMNLQLATPSTFYGFPLSDHLTNHDDVVLKVPLSLPGNITGARDVVPANFEDGLYHGVMSVYLNSQLPLYPDAFRVKTTQLLERQQNCVELYASQKPRQ